MSKTKEMAAVIDELKQCGAIITASAEWLERIFSHEEEKAITLEEVRAVLADLSRAGFTAEIRELIQKYEADKLSAVDPKHYQALLADAKELNHA